jgi:sulfite dehydrogenase (cytochrome) subunit B
MDPKMRPGARLNGRFMPAAAVLSAAASLFAPAGAAAVASEMPVEIKAGAGADKVEGNCAACHSLDYIRMNSPFLGAAGWDAEVSKMINAYGAPISAADAKTIADYLKANYGK